jgi:hypothetical protein
VLRMKSCGPQKTEVKQTQRLYRDNSSINDWIIDRTSVNIGVCAS